MSKRCILITGGARSGKSRFAYELASKLGRQVLFVATAEAGDEEMKCRIEEHKRERPKDWSTIEATADIGNCIKKRIGGARVVIVDCVTLLVNNIFNKYGDQSDEQIDTSLLEKEVESEIKGLVEGIDHSDASFIIVTNEVGLGLVPANKIGRLYRDLLGRANQMLAERADEVYFMVAGLPVKIKPVKLS
ncbi:MAG: bifunctional adenosylcobinamide kinase/adenosylcobinamide-phosphate guanylyltransferase [Chloroflexi bacterium]|nr:bifunctional adenosylcobinamide kinase/adenosylcobinamide-phosphate guanylyltransferase [Chloroflexota bacterium]